MNNKNKELNRVWLAQKNETQLELTEVKKKLDYTETTLKRIIDKDLFSGAFREKKLTELRKTIEELESKKGVLESRIDGMATSATLASSNVQQVLEKELQDRQVEQQKQFELKKEKYRQTIESNKIKKEQMEKEKEQRKLIRREREERQRNRRGRGRGRGGRGGRGRGARGSNRGARGRGGSQNRSGTRFGENQGSRGGTRFGAGRGGANVGANVGTQFGRTTN